MKIKLIAIDIDDTLLSSEGKILPSTKTVLQKALKHGVKVVLCSGRPLPGMRPFLDELGIAGDEQYAINYNGSVIETVSGKVVAETGLSNVVYRQIDTYSSLNGLPYNVLDRNGEIYTSNHDVNRITVVQAWENSAGLLIRKPSEMPADFGIVKGVFVGETEKLDQAQSGVQQEFGSENYVVRAADNFLEIMNATADKGKALTKLTETLGLDKSEVMAIGDERNDIPMFDFAGQAVAMGNSSSAAKEHASYLTASNDNDGIAQALNELVF